MYKLVLIGICLFLLHILVKRSDSGKKVGCLLPAIVACAWLATLLLFFMENGVQRAWREDLERHSTTAAPPTETTKSIEWYQAAGQKMPDKDFFEESFKKAPLVIIGTVEKIEPYQGNSVHYITIRPQTVLKGTAEEVIYSYDNAEEIDVAEGGTYLMMLSRDHLTVYPHPRHTSLSKNPMYEVKDGKFTDEWYPSKLPTDLDEAIAYMKSIPVEAVEERPMPEFFELNEEKLAECEYITRVKVAEVSEIHPHAADVRYVIREHYKGQLEIVKKTMPSRVNWQKGKEYILFLDEYNDHIQLAAYNGAVICEDDEMFSQAVDILEIK